MRGSIVGAGEPAKQAPRWLARKNPTRCMAPAAPVFAATAAPTGVCAVRSPILCCRPSHSKATLSKLHAPTPTSVELEVSA
ncbi:hypothetical protein D0O09_24125 [Pseudomonas putida]|nr:hypothetical protein D0O09_24125 [Pseudomonas putida]